jgi:two-component system, OmpR family, response regulator MtrA
MSRVTSGPGPGIVLCFGVPPDEFAKVARAVSGRTTLVTAPDTADGLAMLLAATGLPPPDEPARREIRVGALALDVERREATWEGLTLDLSARSFDLMVVLAGDPGRTWTFAELTTQVWDRTYLGDSDAVISAVKRLRRQLGGVASSVVIESVRGVGFRLLTSEQPPGPVVISRPRVVADG